jgi:signal transduction histidine kinase
LIDGILDISKIEAGNFELHAETVDPFDALNAVVTSTAPFAAARSIVGEQDLCEPFVVQANRVQFKQILYNLFSDAVKFTPGAAESPSSALSRVCLRNFLSAIQESQEEQAAIFDKFYQVDAMTKGVREGTGLGLAITKHLVEQHGGLRSKGLCRRCFH